MVATRQVAKALILDGSGNFLLLKRADTHPVLAGFYDLPGGILEPLEEPGAAVMREVKEETGIDLVIADIMLLFSTTKLLYGRSYPTLLYLARIDAYQPEVAISWEHQSYEWASLDRLPEVEPQLAPTYRDALQYILQHDIIEDIDKR